MDAESGLYYYNARYYDPELGRFIQPDMVIPDLSNPQSFNRYSYCINNPLRYTDPSGHEDEDETDNIPLTYGAAHAALRQAQGGASAQLYQQSKADMRTAAAVGRAIAEANPIVGTYNGVSEAKSGQDAIDPNVQLSVRQRVMAGFGAVGSLIPGEGAEAKAGALILKNAKRGRAAEAKVLKDMGLIKNTEKVVGKEGKSIPDYITKDAIGEIKDSKRVVDSPQLRIQRESAGNAGKIHEVNTGVNTKVSETVQRQSQVIRREDLGPK
jgi:RHS repeat-associated protein